MDKVLLKEMLTSPIHQGWLTGIFALVFMLILHYKGSKTIIDAGIFWMYVFITLNLGMAFIQPRIWSYFVKSAGVFLLLLILIPMCIFVITTIAKSSDTMKAMKIFWIPAIAYPVLSLVVALIRWFFIRVV